jgi:hypothetical protein
VDETLIKPVWDQADFDSMGWHDVRIHAFATFPDTFEIAFDIDYIAGWEKPAPDSRYFRFHVAPATLVFTDVSSVVMNIESGDGTLTLEEMQREKAEPTPTGEPDYLWTLAAHEGLIAVRASGFRQYLRRQPVLVDTQSFTLADRGGVSFARRMS